MTRKILAIPFFCLFAFTSHAVFALTCTPTSTPVVNEDGSVSITLNLRLATGESAPTISLTQSAKGTLTTSPKQPLNTSTSFSKIFTYTPAANYNGSDKFSWKGSATLKSLLTSSSVSCSQNVPISVVPVNDAPTTKSFATSTKEKTEVTFTLTGTDPDGDPLTFSLSNSTTHGTATLVNSQTGEVRFTPEAGFIGTDTDKAVVTFKANDGKADSVGMATVTITVTEDCVQATPADDVTALIAALPVKESGATTKICFASGEYKQNVEISGKENLILKAEGDVNFIEVNSDKKNADGTPVYDGETYYGATLKISDSRNIVLDHLTVTNNHKYSGSVGHMVARALDVKNSSDVVIKNSHIVSNGKQTIESWSSTLNIFDSKVDGLYFPLASEGGSVIYTENSTYTHIHGDGHAFFWVFYGDLYFKNCTFVIEESGGFLAGYNDPELNRIIVDNPTVINVGTKSLTSLVNQHHNYYGINLYWMGSLPDLLEAPERYAFGVFFYDPYSDPENEAIAGPADYVKICLSEDSGTPVVCNECVTPKGTYTKAFTTQEEQDEYISTYCQEIEEDSPTYSDVNSRRCYWRDPSDQSMHLLPSCPAP